jgi:hypothetical protein
MITLDEVILAFESVMSEDDYSVDVYYDTLTKTIEYVVDDDEAYDGGFEDSTDESDRIYIRTDLDDRSVMTDFVASKSDPELSRIFKLTFHGRDRLARVKDVFQDFGIIEEYYRHRETVVTEEALRWLSDHGIPFIRN